MGFLHAYMNQTCPEKIDQYIRNLTSSYTDKRNEPTMVSASVIMFILAGLFFNLNLFSGISDISAILDPRVRRFLTSALSLFLPVMSYLFSEAKNAVPAQWVGPTAASRGSDLSLKAGLILAWMLLVELLRKKADEVRMRGYSGSIMRAGRVVWLGNLVFFNIKSAGRKALFSILWILCATRVVQRIAYTEIGKRSYEHGKNPRLISSCMARIMPKKQKEQLVADHPPKYELLRNCEYVVMGEAKLVKKATAGGYKLVAPEDDSAVRVGKVWKLADAKTDEPLTFCPAKDKRLKRLCLSFALFKLLRRRLEHAPAGTADQEARDCRDLIFKDGGLVDGLRDDEDGGLVAEEEASHCRDKRNGGADGRESAAEALFQVVHDEVNFLSEYYHSVVPVALASPSFLVVNYLFVLVVVALLCLMTVILCGNGDAGYAFRSIGNDNYVLRFGIAKLTACVFSKAIQSPSAFFSALDLGITALLFAIYFYEEIWEFFVFLFSDWFMVSLLASYMASKSKAGSGWFKKLSFRFAICCLVRLRSKLSQPRLRFRQFSALNLRWPSRLPFVPSLYMGTPKVFVDEDVKKSIIDYLEEHARGCGTADYTPLSNGSNALKRFPALSGACDSSCVADADSTPLSNGRNELERLPCFHDLSSACKSSSVAEVILTWHIATSILEAENAPQPNKADQGGRARCSVGHMPFFKKNKADQEQPDKAMTSSRVAISLSKYCAYLVAFHPELLPDNPEKAKEVVKDMKAELREMLGRQDYYLSPLSKRVKKIMEEDQKPETASFCCRGVKKISDKKSGGVVEEGKKLATELQKRPEDAWALLADVWTELVVFVAPSNDEECVKAHEKVLVQGGEFITVLWALTTHTGVTRTQPTADSKNEPCTGAS
ncbi:hypothetical protein EJB05_40556, partial [Eragrostis curvula]